MANIPDPITRKEQYYSYMAGESSYLPEPITREEQYLYYLCVNGSGGGGGSGTTNYNELNNKPKINGKTLEGNNSAEYYGMISENQGKENSGKILKVNDEGKVIASDITVENHIIHI